MKTTINISGYDVIIDAEDKERVLSRHWYVNKKQIKTHNKIRYNLGTYSTEDEAYAARLEKEANLLLDDLKNV